MRKITFRSHPMLVLSLSLHALLIAVILVLPARPARKADRPPRLTEISFHRPPKAAEPEPKPVEIARAKPPAPRRAPERQNPPALVAPPVVRHEPIEPPHVEPPAVPVVVATALPPSPPPPPPPPVVHREIRLGGFKEEKETKGPAPERAHSDRAVVQTAAFAVASADPPTPMRETRAVASASFDTTVGSGNGGTKNVDRGSVTRTSFDTAAETGASAPRRRERPVEKPDMPVEVLSKPKPAYTDEARRLRVEGEVILEVTFIATGHLRVLRVLGSLGHGLDEAAIEAAKKIQFTPARRDGRPVDHTATLRVVFQLT